MTTKTPIKTTPTTKTRFLFSKGKKREKNIVSQELTPIVEGTSEEFVVFGSHEHYFNIHLHYLSHQRVKVVPDVVPHSVTLEDVHDPLAMLRLRACLDAQLK